MREMLKTIAKHLTQGEELVLVTVIASSGATPRGAGARMLVGENGRICGTIGGGAVEFRSEQIAASVLREKSSRGHDFTLTRDDVQNLGMICGGDCNVFFHYLPAVDPDTLALARAAELRFADGKDLWLISDLAAGGKLTLADRSDPLLAPLLTRRPYRLQQDGKDLYIEQICTAGRVYIFGGGHVAQELVPVLAHVGFRCVVMDDRPEFTRPELFPDAEQIVCGDLRRIDAYLDIGPEDYVCVMTRGHAYDTVVQAQVLQRGPCYCGVIGSRQKAAGVRRVLQEEYGLTEQTLALVTTPIGLDIQAETPEEIAVSIAAQLILHRAEHKRQ